MSINLPWTKKTKTKHDSQLGFLCDYSLFCQTLGVGRGEVPKFSHKNFKYAFALEFLNGSKIPGIEPNRTETRTYSPQLKLRMWLTYC